MKSLLVIFLLVVSESLFNSRVLGDSLTLTKEQCVKSIKKMDTVSGFLEFANKLIRNNDVSSINEQENTIMNRCLHSVNGQNDIIVLKRIVDQASVIHSVCEPDYIDQLIAFDRQIKIEHVSYGKLLRRKQTNRLLPFFRLFVGQVVLTCKQSLEKKLTLIENENKQLVESINNVANKIARSEALREAKVAESSDKSIKLPAVLRLALKIHPRTQERIENLVILDSVTLNVGITLNSDGAYKEFLKTKESCKTIDMYARSSFYPIARLAWKGYMARKANKQIITDLDESEQSEIVQKWMKVLQYCQGVLTITAYLDREQESELKLGQESGLVDEQPMVLEVKKNQCSLDTDDNIESDSCTMTEWHRFEEVKETFKELDENLSCYTFRSRLVDWLARRLMKNEQILAKYIKISSYDNSFVRTLDEDVNGGDNSEKDVQFATIIHRGGGGHGGGHAAAHGGHGGHSHGGHAASHGAKGSHGHAHYYYLFGSHVPAWEAALIVIGIITLGSIVLVFLIIAFQNYRNN